LSSVLKWQYSAVPKHPISDAMEILLSIPGSE